MAKVLDFPKKGDHFPVCALCLVCFHKWIGLISSKTSLFKLECPNCHNMDSFASFVTEEYLREFLPKGD